MINKIRNYCRGNDVFIKNSIILFSCTLFLNIAGYVFHLFMGRMLGPEEYGILGSLQAIVYLMLIPLNTIQTSITNFVARFKARNEYSKISYLLSDSLKKFALYGGILSIIFVIISPLIASFFHIPSTTPLIFLGGFLFAAFMVAISRGLFQGLQNFWQLGVNYMTEGLTKFVIGIPIIAFLGMGVSGAILGGFTLALFVPFLLSLFVIIPLIRKQKEKFNTSKVYFYSIPVLIMMIVTTAIYTIDMILVKHFFTNTEAGYYAAIALIGKVIFFGSLSIAMVMFPRVAELQETKKNFKKTIRKALAISALFCFGITLVYFLLPKLAVSILFGSEYLSIAPLIGPFGIFMSLVSLTYLLSYYNISIKKKKFLYPLTLLTILEAILLIFFHQSITQVVYILLCLGAVMFLSTFAITKLQKNI
ncbi:MAG: oligosaccharide flippase family protein [Nanoarchaeota archaeon]|nr:oligosaccharide flippase family protein [Nanoarchaeota archaeon]